MLKCVAFEMMEKLNRVLVTVTKKEKTKFIAKVVLPDRTESDVVGYIRKNSFGRELKRSALKSC